MLKIEAMLMLQYVWLLKSTTILLPNIYEIFSADWQRGSVGHTDCYVALYMIKHIIMAKLIWCVNDISNCGPAYVPMCLITEGIYIITPGHLLRLLGQMAKMGL